MAAQWTRWPRRSSRRTAGSAPFERLEIYNRQYWYRVLGALAEDFPRLRAVIGGRAFEAMSIAYLSEHPSRSFSLRNLGSHLTDVAQKESALCRTARTPGRRRSQDRVGIR